MTARRRGISLVEVAVAIAVASLLAIALDGQLDQLHRVQALLAARLPARQAAATVARRLLADPSPAARRALEAGGLPDYTVRLERSPDEPAPGVHLWRVHVAPRTAARFASDTVEVLLRD